MQKSDSNRTARATRRRTKSSTTLNRKYVRQPRKATDVIVRVKKDSMASRSNTEIMKQAIIERKDSKSITIGVDSASSMENTDMMNNMGTMDSAASMMGTMNDMAAMDTSSMMADMDQTSTMSSTENMDVMAAAEVHPIQSTANSRMKKRQSTKAAKTQKTSPTAKELKDQAIKKALESAAATPMLEMPKGKRASTKAAKSVNKIHFGFGRVLLALSCAAAAVFAITYFVNLNMPDISLRVAAMQTGINASYPSYVPRDFSISSITSEDGKVTLDFNNSGTGDAFTLVEEASSWDSNALMTNYVKEEFGENYTIVKEQGLTIYISGSNAAWVNGGVVYKINTTSGSLTNKQIKSIAVSL